jgi:predicted TIM-barrel fold metal-dependent hydrolase
MKLDFFDCNCQIGRPGSPVEGAPVTAREIVTRLQPMGIRRALVYSVLSKELHPVEGNAAVLEEVKGSPLVPCWAALPTATGEIGTPEEFVAAMRANGVGAVRLFPTTHSYCIQEWCVGPLFEELERSRVPVFVEATQTNYDHIAAALKAFPQLRLIVLRPSYRCDRFIYPLMERYEHLCLDTSNYVPSGGIEEICSRFGSSRLIFGTGMPFFEPGAAVSSVTYAEIDDADKQAIAGGNLERLLAWAGEGSA